MAEGLHPKQPQTIGAVSESVSVMAIDCAYAQIWASPPAVLRLEADTVHLWQASLALEPGLLIAMRATLSTEEENRAEQFSTGNFRNRYVAGRGILRNILGRYLGESPDRIRFRYGEFGKPELVDWENLSFNLSHTHDRALYAITAGRRIGVDIECLDRPAHSDRLGLAKRFFSQREYYELCQTPGEERDQAFLRCWTRKEAFVKAIGQGLTCPLDQFDVTLIKNEPAAVRATRWDASEAARWSMVHVAPASDAVGAVVVEAPPPQIAQWWWAPEKTDIGPLNGSHAQSVPGASVWPQQ